MQDSLTHLSTQSYAPYMTDDPTVVCTHCGNTIPTLVTRRTPRYCTPACKAAARRASGTDNETRTCAHCNAPFTINRFAKATCCSSRCGARMRWAKQP